MGEAIKMTLRDSKKARWTALIIVSFTMFAGYMFTEIISPMKSILERTYGWDSADFGIVTGAYSFFNVFFLMLLVVGILLDKFGIRMSNVLSGVIMIIGAFIKWYAFKGGFSDEQTIHIFGYDMTHQVFWAAFGYALFGIGVEYGGITITKAIAKWFKGKEVALAMGMQVAIARIGSSAPLAFGAFFAEKKGVPFTIFIVIISLIIGLACFFYFNYMDKKLDKQLGAQDKVQDEEEFRFADLLVIVKNRGFWLIAILCVLFYSAVFPFYKYGSDLMVNKFGVSERWGGLFPSLVPFGTMILTPLFGSIFDKKGKGATLMIIGSVLLVIVHIVFYLPFLNHVAIAFFNVIILGVGFSLVPSALWPAVPKIIPERQLGSAYAVIFWIQNIGLMIIPFLVGIMLNSTNPTIAPDKKLVNDAFEQTYVETLNNSKFIGVKDAKGDVIEENDIKIFGRNTAGDLINKIIVEAPQDLAVDFNREDLSLEVKKEVEDAIRKYLAGLTEEDLRKVNDDKELASLEKLNETAVQAAFQVVSSKNIKLNYSYTHTWTIFVVLTVLALLISLWLKKEDKRKGYGLEFPNIEEQ